MAGLKFSNEAAFAVALQGGLVPPDILATPVRFARVRSGSRAALAPPAIVVDAGDLPSDAQERLVRAGASRVKLPATLELAPLWPAVIAPTRVPEASIESALFRVEAPARALDLAASLASLGASRVEIASFEGGALVLATGPSHYFVSLAADRAEGLSVFVRASTAADVFIEVHHRHPALSGLVPAKGELLLFDREARLERIHPGPFQNALDVLEVTVAAAAPPGPALPLPKHRLPLKLVRSGKTKKPSLWVLRAGAVAAMDRLVSSLPEAALASLSFVALDAASHDPAPARGEPICVLRALPGASALSIVEGEAYAVVPELGDVFVPEDAVVQPPLGAQRLRGVVGGPDDRVRWLRKTEAGVVVESAPRSAFSPLVDWVELVAARVDFTAWLGNIAFDPIAFEASARPFDDEGAPDPERPAREGARERATTERKRRAREPIEHAPAPAEIVAAEPAAEASVIAPPRPEPTTATPAPPELGASLVEAEQRVAQSALPLAAPERDAAWLELAQRYLGAGLVVDARICFSRLLSSGRPVADAARRAFVDGMLAQSRVARGAGWKAATSGASGGNVELCVALLAAQGPDAPAPSPAELEKARALVDAAEAHLDIRSAWIARAAIARASGDDALLVARARDRALTRLARGLSIGRDMPRAIRALEVSRAPERLRALQDVLAHFESTPRVKGPLEADPKTTLAYVHLVFTCAFARAGDTPRAKVLQSGASIAKMDAIHKLLVDSFGARIQQAIDAEPETTPLPAALGAAYDALGRLDRYKVDRVRQASKLLEPDVDLDPFRSFGAADNAGAAEAIARVAEAIKPSEAGKALDAIASAAQAEPDLAQRRRRLTTLSGALLHAPASVASSRFDAVLEIAKSFEGADRVRALCGALALAEKLERNDAAGAILLELERDFEKLTPSAIPGLSPHLARATRAIARTPARDAAEALLRSLRARVATHDAPARIGRLVLTRALVELGAAPEGAELLAADLKFLDNAEVAPADRLQLARSVASCAVALGDLATVRSVAAIWRRMTDSYNTNSHLCLSAVELADAVAWSLAPRIDDATSLARRLVDEDEHAVRAAIFGR